MMVIVTIILLASLQPLTFAQRQRQITLPPVVIPGNSTGGCPVREDRLQTAKNNVLALLPGESTPDLTIVCGLGQWTRVAYLDMSDLLQSCPSAWHLNTSSGIRRCGRPPNSDDMCHGTFYSPGGRIYTKVCGRVIGYQVGNNYYMKL